MGLLEDLSALALAPLLRESEDIARRLPERLASPDGELVSALRLACDRAWTALECVLGGERFRELCAQATIAREEDQTLRPLLLFFLDTFLNELPSLGPPSLLDAALTELRAVRQTTLLLGPTLDRPALVAAVQAILRDGERAENEALARMAAALVGAGHPQLATLLVPRDRPPLLVRAVRTFLRVEVIRTPSVLRGPEARAAETAQQVQERAFEYLDQVFRHHRLRLLDWLRLFQPPSTLTEISLEPIFPPAAPAPAPPRRPTGPPTPFAPASGVGPRTPATGEGPGTPVTRVGPRTPPQAEPSREMVARPADLRRRASLRWFRKMNPQRMYPLTVILAKGRVKEVRVEGVGQAAAPEMLVVSATQPYVLVRPVLPGVCCYPPEQTVDATSDLATVRFQVMPQVLGVVPDARVEFYHQQRLLSSIPLEMKVSRQTAAMVVSVVGLSWPFLGAVLRSVTGSDDAPRAFVLGMLAAFLNWPYAIETGLGALAMLALGLYLWNRPRETTEETDVLGVRPMTLAELLAAAHEAVLQDRWDDACGLYEDAVNVAPNDSAAREGLEAVRRRLQTPHVPPSPGQILQAVSVNPANDSTAHHDAYLTALRGGHWEDALTHLREAVRRSPGRYEPFPFARYQPMKVLGAGGFGVAVLCEDRQQSALVVVKALLPSSRRRPAEQILAEARALSRLSHPAIVRLRDLGTTGGDRPYLVMDYFEGESLHSHVRKHGPLSPQETWELAWQMAHGLKAAHDAGVLHRDVKAGNVLIRTGDRELLASRELQVKLIDFGLAMPVARRASTATTPRTHPREQTGWAGTLEYAAPEQLGQLPGVPVGTWSDVFGFGRTCYYALLGTSQPDDREKTTLVGEWQALLSDCTARTPEYRLPDFAAVLERLNGF